MTPRRIRYLFMLPALILLASCDKQSHDDNDGHGHGAEGPKSPTEATADPHDHGSEGTGATFEEGKGISLLEETSQAIGLEWAEVAEREVLPEAKLTAQVYRSAGEASRVHGRERTDHAYATALILEKEATHLRMGQKLTFLPKDSPADGHEGVVWRIDTTQVPVLGKTEVLMELSDPDRSLRVGEFVEARIPLSRAPVKSVSIPASAVLQTSTGTYAFVKNGRHLLRTEIQTGIRNADTIEVTGGLYEGDTVALKPVETLYMIELRATKGGGHCH